MIIHYEKFLEEGIQCETAQDELIERIHTRNCIEKTVGYKIVELTFELPASSKIENVTCEDCLSIYAHSISGMN